MNQTTAVLDPPLAPAPEVLPLPTPSASAAAAAPDAVKVCRTIDSPVGPLTLAGVGTTLTNLRMVDQSHPPADGTTWEPDDTAFPDAVAQLEEYFAGTRTTFELALRLDGTDFQQRVWAALQQIPYGETWSYGGLARHIGNPNASRAVGLANGRNPIGIIVPCHRVIGASGSLTGYGGGLDRKRALLDLEQSRRQPHLDLGT